MRETNGAVMCFRKPVVRGIVFFGWVDDFKAFKSHW